MGSIIYWIVDAWNCLWLGKRAHFYLQRLLRFAFTIHVLALGSDYNRPAWESFHFILWNVFMLSDSGLWLS